MNALSTHGLAAECHVGSSTFSTLAELEAGLPHFTGDGMDILLASARLFDDGFAPLRPLWAQEAIHRAISMVRLFAALQRRHQRRRPLHNIHERRLALHLARELASLETIELRRVHPCSGPLREAARDLVALFGPAAGQIAIETNVAPLSLPGYKRRALVLLGHELVTNALLHAFHGRGGGRLVLRLHRSGAGQARLQVGDDGAGFTTGRPNRTTSIAGGLADLLEGELRYVDEPPWTTMADVVFPIVS